MHLAQQGFSVVAVDFVPAALAAAKTRAEPDENAASALAPSAGEVPGLPLTHPSWCPLCLATDVQDFLKPDAVEGTAGSGA